MGSVAASVVSSVEAVASVTSVVGWGSVGAEVSSGAAVSGAAVVGGSVVGTSVTGASVSTSTASVAAWVSSISSANTGVTS